MKAARVFIKKPLVYLISNGEITPQNFPVTSRRLYEVAETAARCEISLFQIREKNLSAKLLFELTRTIVEITKNSAMKVLVNDRADIALAAKADGVHLTEKSLPTKVIRQNFPPDFIIGVSTHSAEKIETSINEKADFVVFSPIFDTPEKGASKGLKELEKVCRKFANFPIIALGGINEKNYESVLHAGASGFAAIRFLNDLPKLEKLALKLNNER